MDPNEHDRQAAGAGRTAPPGAEDEAADVGALQAALAAAESRALESRDLYMRALAELENVRKRATRDVEQAHKFSLERIANDLIGVKDSLELGLASAGSAEALREGTQATLQLLSKALEKAGITEITPQGEQFDPQLHEAMVMQPSAQHVPNSITQVVQKGYQLNGRLLRPARVIVAKEP
ncbi:MAG TPA: nucleotide exchange factor GrpE [Steroidobacteraceae bacterium]|nr:nucleotide exchange factor GrpE [Steroidobacteraceae bacterium]